MSYELYLPPEPPKPYRDPKTGRFVKGMTPRNKGKKWDEYLTPEAQAKARKGWANIQLHRPTSRPETAGRRRKAVVGLTATGEVLRFVSLKEAGRYMQGCHENIRRCCKLNRDEQQLKDTKGNLTNRTNTDHTYKRIRWYYESDLKWLYKS